MVSTPQVILAIKSVLSVVLSSKRRKGISFSKSLLFQWIQLESLLASYAAISKVAMIVPTVLAAALPKKFTSF